MDYKKWVLANKLEDTEKSFRAWLELTDTEFQKLTEEQKKIYTEKMFLYRFAAI